MRKYFPVWKELKEKGVCSISAHKVLHPRIIKAISKEKNTDMGYKILLAEKSLKAILTHRAHGARIQFFLRNHPLDANNLSVENF